MPFEVRDVQVTPNPNAMKFVLDRKIADRPVSYLSAASAASDEVAARLFAIPGVAGVLFLGDFITVNKRPDVKWSQITPAVRQVLSEA
ncbi:MAG: NifU N-terminal domain-containing protein [Phycisphaerae bacterium]|nr:NifU N-terminal domain-containing protein [Phycisphaerae bacterium]MDW8261857.1 NifU N-terminal domain-containing protein [Phycisphaerales bacterium]